MYEEHDIDLERFALELDEALGRGADLDEAIERALAWL